MSETVKRSGLSTAREYSVETSANGLVNGWYCYAELVGRPSSSRSVRPVYHGMTPFSGFLTTLMPSRPLHGTNEMFFGKNPALVRN